MPAGARGKPRSEAPRQPLPTKRTLIQGGECFLVRVRLTVPSLAAIASAYCRFIWHQAINGKQMQALSRSDPATEVWREDGKGVGIYVAAASIVVFAGRKAKAPVRYGVTGAVSNDH